MDSNSDDAAAAKDSDDSDVDGMPLNIPGRKSSSHASKAAPASSSSSRGGFVPSKWETIDPEDVQAQAVTSSKWDFEGDSGARPKVNKLGIQMGGMGNDDDDTDEDVDGKTAVSACSLCVGVGVLLLVKELYLPCLPR